MKGQKGQGSMPNSIIADEREGRDGELGRRSARHTGSRSASSRTEFELGTVSYHHHPFE